MDNSEAIAYSFLMLCLFLLLAAGFYLIVAVMFNAIFDVSNTMIASNMTSEQTKNAISWGRDAWMAIPIITLVACFVWAVGAKAVSPGTVEFSSLYTGWVIMVIMVIVSTLMAFSGGMIIDSLYQNLDEAGYTQGGEHMNAAWGNIQNDTMYYFINLYYFLCYFVPVLGFGVLFQSVARDTAGTRYYRTGY